MKKYRVRKGSVADVTVKVCEWVIPGISFIVIAMIPMLIGILAE